MEPIHPAKTPAQDGCRDLGLWDLIFFFLQIGFGVGILLLLIEVGRFLDKHFPIGDKQAAVISLEKTNNYSPMFVWKTNDYSPTIVWEYDDARRDWERVAKLNMAAEAFNKTNTNPSQFANLQTSRYYVDFQKVRREFGYRDDGIVVWRVPPEAEPRTLPVHLRLPNVY